MNLALYQQVKIQVKVRRSGQVKHLTYFEQVKMTRQEDLPSIIRVGHVAGYSAG